jgi:hypothetical protein
VAWVAVAVALQLGRQEGVPAVHTLWAEDGSAYLADALNGAPLSLFHVYAGYIQPIPRAVAGLASLFPPEHASAVFAVVATLVVALVSLYTFGAVRPFIPTFGGRAAIAVLVALLPAAGWESLANGVNLQWHLLFPCFLSLLPGRPGAARRTVVEAGFALGAPLATPVAAVFLPVAAWRAWRDRSRPAVVVVGAYLMALLIQGLAVLTADSPFREPTSGGVLPGLYGLRVAASLLAGDAILPVLWRSLGWVVGYGALAVVLMLLVLGATRRPRAVRAAIVAAVGTSVLAFVVPVFVRGTALVAPYGEEVNLLGSRWTIAPILLLGFAILAALDPAEARGSRLPLTLRALVVMLLAIGIVSGFRVTNARSPGPVWPREVARAEERCRARGDDRVDVPVSPGAAFPPGPFFARIECAALA